MKDLFHVLYLLQLLHVLHLILILDNSKMLLALKKSLIIILVPIIHLEHKLQVQAKFLDLIIKLLIDNSKQLSLVMIDEVLFRLGKLRSG